MNHPNGTNDSFWDDEDELMFKAEEEEEESISSAAKQIKNVSPTSLPWSILVVDDEPDIHKMTQMALTNFRYHERSLELISAHSAAQAKVILTQRTDIAVILLDVVMETDDAGLLLVVWIRKQLLNQKIRIILRTGQPGQAPERRVIVDYQINDYKAKHELTADRLFSTMVTALRSYEDLLALEASQHGMKTLLDISETLFKMLSMQQFADGVLSQLSTLLDMPIEALLCMRQPARRHPRILAGTGRYQACVSNENTACLHEQEIQAIVKTLQTQENIYKDDYITLFIPSQTINEGEFAVYLNQTGKLLPMQQMLLHHFCDKLATSLNNIQLFERNNFLLDQLQRAHQATVVTLADFAEYKAQKTGNHVLRIADMIKKITHHLAQESPYTHLIDETILELIGMASILHDIGKMTVPDSILQKPGPLTTEERQIMESHALRGEEILYKASKMTEGVTYLSLGATIAGSHHEKFDGTGYPRGLQGEQIPLVGRITALVDVYDELSNEGPNKSAWPPHQVYSFIKNSRGSQFDPVVVDAFLACFPQPE